MNQVDYSVLNDKLLLEYKKIFLSCKKEIDKKLNGLKLEIELGSKKETREINFDYLLTAPFEELNLIKEEFSIWVSSFDKEIKHLKKLKKKEKTQLVNTFNNLFTYKKFQPAIADFFSNQMNLSDICYYCNEQYISSFLDIHNDYIDVYDFLNHATKDEMVLVNGIGDKTSEKIISYRKHNKKKFNSVKDLRNADIKNIDIGKIWEQLKAMNTHNYFTLDHVLPQADYPFFSLSLHNFVPCCYSCNSKFKKKINFEKNIIKSSPTSKDFEINKSFEFKLTSKVKEDLIIEDITLHSLVKETYLKIQPTLESKFNRGEIAEEEFILQKDLIEEYFKMFKLNGRYMNHKHHAITLANKRIKYSESQIEAIAKSLKISKDVVKKDVFGPAVINPNENVPLSKLFHDIAKQFKII